MADIPSDTTGLPYWVTDGQVALNRQTYGSSGKHGKAGQEFWRQPHRFFVPAFSASLEHLLTHAKNLLLRPPALQPGAAAPFEPVIRSIRDVRPAAEFIVMAIEADRKDKLNNIDFKLELSQPVLWILPKA